MSPRPIWTLYNFKTNFQRFLNSKPLTTEAAEGMDAVGITIEEGFHIPCASRVFFNINQ